MNLVKAHLTSIKAWLAVLGPIAYKFWTFEQPSFKAWMAAHPAAPLTVVIGAIIIALNSNPPGTVKTANGK
jgi:hypothetical protein